MFEIVKAQVTDMPTLLGVAEVFVPFHGMKWNEEAVTRMLTKVIEDGTVYLAFKDGDFAGCIGGIETINLWTDESIMQELFWWVEPKYRGSSIGVRLLKIFEDSCNVPVHMSLLPQTPVKPALLSKLGYSLRELTYIKE